jgi:hypothetical protein
MGGEQEAGGKAAFQQRPDKPAQSALMHSFFTIIH